MLFNSLIFVLFALLFFGFYWLIKKRGQKWSWAYITLFSFVFYGWWDWRFLFLIIGSGLIDFFAGQAIYKKPKYKKALLILSLVGNLGTLAAFKYSRFVLGQIEILLANVGIEANISAGLPDFLYILPIGISFYTFQSMSYTIDIYKGELKPTHSILKFFAYLSMFPQLVAGPIVRSKTLMPQLDKLKPTNEIERWHGARLIASGLFKKMLIADNIAPLVNTAFANVNQTHSSIYWWIVMIGFAFQIYCDFSGYTDIARGLAKWMGLHFKMNFNHPYRAASIKEFWQRWHISLSTWFRDYVYIPLGGSKKGQFKSHLFMWITMITSGFWHGASWNFIIWGWLHAMYLSVERITGWSNFLKRKHLKALSVLIVFFQVTIAWVFFRAETFKDALSVLSNMLSFNRNTDFLSNNDVRNGIHYVLFALVVEFVFLNFKWKRNIKNKQIVNYIEIIFLGLIVAASLFLRGKGQEFIYFQF